jgi:hypothetical protein
MTRVDTNEQITIFPKPIGWKMLLGGGVIAVCSLAMVPFAWSDGDYPIAWLALGFGVFVVLLLALLIRKNARGNPVPALMLSPEGLHLMGGTKGRDPLGKGQRTWLLFGAPLAWFGDQYRRRRFRWARKERGFQGVAQVRCRNRRSRAAHFGRPAGDLALRPGGHDPRLLDRPWGSAASTEPSPMTSILQTTQGGPDGRTR